MTIEAQTRVPDLNALPEHALLTRKQVHQITGFAEITLRVWAKQGRGPKARLLDGNPRYQVGDLKAWIEGAAQ